MSFERLPEAELFDPAHRIQHLNRLRSQLGLQALDESVQSEQLPSAGIEIEITWDQAFQNMHAQWLGTALRPTDLDSSSQAYRDFARQYSENDARLKPLLNKITPVIPHVGNDSYWEFSFRPTQHAHVANAELSTLYDAGILFEGIEYPTHLTIAGIPTDRDAGAILCKLEQEGGATPERIASAVSSIKGSWARKGTGGVRERSYWELEGGTTHQAYEFRTLVTTAPEQMNRIFALGQAMAYRALHDRTAWLDEREEIEAPLRAAGLPVSEWPHPKRAPLVWQKYTELLATSNE